MNDEIKEILEEIDNKIIPNEHWNKIKDCITNLQQENERLKQRIEFKNTFYNFVIDKYKSRCEKIRNYVNSTNFVYDEQYKKKDKIENILNGGDKE